MDDRRTSSKKKLGHAGVRRAALRYAALRRGVG